METKRIIIRMLSWGIYLCIFLVFSGCTVEGREVPVQELPIEPQEYPDFIDSVQPEPGSIFSLSDPADRNLIYFTNNVERILCVLIMQQPLLRPNDHFNEFENIELTYDGRVITDEPYHELTALEAEGLDDENGNIIATGIESDLICWDVQILPGIHAAEIRVWTSTGEEFTYSWAFEVVK